MEDKKYIIHHIDEELKNMEKLQSIYDEPGRDIEKYFIAYESDPRPHFHLLTFSTEKTYNALMAKIKATFNLVEKQKALRTKGSKGGRCLYTRVKDPTKDYETFITYIQKEQTGLFKSKGFSESLIAELGKKSFKKNEPKKNIDTITDYLESKGPFGSSKKLSKYFDEYGNLQWCESTIQLATLTAIYTYINETDINLSLSRTAINNYYLNYLRKTKHYNMQEKVQLQMFFNSHL